MARIPDDVREAVARAARLERTSRSIAAEFGISVASVSNICRELGVQRDRSATEKATRATIADLAKRRAELAGLLLEDAHRLRAQLWERAQVAMVVSQGGENGSMIVDHELPEPTFRDKQAIATATGIVLDKHLKLVDRDASPDLVAGRSLLETVGTMLANAFGDGSDRATGEPGDDDQHG